MSAPFRNTILATALFAITAAVLHLVRAAEDPCPGDCYKGPGRAWRECRASQEVFNACSVQYCDNPETPTYFACKPRPTTLDPPACPDKYRRSSARAEADCTLLGSAIPGCTVGPRQKDRPNGPVDGSACASEHDEGSGDGRTCPDTAGEFVPCDPSSRDLGDAGTAGKVSITAQADTKLSLTVTVNVGTSFTNGLFRVKLGNMQYVTMTCTKTGTGYDCEAPMTDFPLPMDETRCCQALQLLFIIDVTIDGSISDVTSDFTMENFFECYSCPESNAECNTSSCSLSNNIM